MTDNPASLNETSETQNSPHFKDDWPVINANSPNGLDFEMAKLRYENQHLKERISELVEDCNRLRALVGERPLI